MPSKKKIKIGLISAKQDTNINQEQEDEDK